MIPSELDYVRPRSLSETLLLLQEHGEEGQILAGGHTLLPLLKMRLAAPGLLIDIQDLYELKGITFEENQIKIGAMTRHVDLQNSEALLREWPVFSKAATQIADIQVRNRGTIGGSLSAADPSADWPAIILMLDATIELQSTQGKRVLSAKDYFTGMLETARNHDEILVEINIPRNAKNKITDYQKFRHPASGYAIASVGTCLTLKDNKVESARIAVSGVGEKAYLAKHASAALESETITPDLIERASRLVTENVETLSDHFANEDYRKQLAYVMCRRALTYCSDSDRKQ